MCLLIAFPVFSVCICLGMTRVDVDLLCCTVGCDMQCWLLYLLLGFVELDLHKTIIPAKVPEKCNIDMIPEYKADSSQKAPRTASLFEQKSMKGWWPCYVEKDGSRILAVRLLLLLKILQTCSPYFSNYKERLERVSHLAVSFQWIDSGRKYFMHKFRNLVQQPFFVLKCEFSTSFM